MLIRKQQKHVPSLGRQVGALFLWLLLSVSIRLQLKADYGALFLSHIGLGASQAPAQRPPKHSGSEERTPPPQPTLRGPPIPSQPLSLAPDDVGPPSFPGARMSGR